MDYYKRKSNISRWVICVIVASCTLALIAAIVFGFVRMKYKNDPVESAPPIETAEQETPDIEIPVINPEPEQGRDHTGSLEEETDEAGYVSIDILEINKGNEKENKPHIVGDVSILPGVKEDSHETNK